MSEMVERVTGAILGAVFGKDVPLELSAEELAKNAARAAIEAMREPTPEMIQAARVAFRNPSNTNWEDIFSATFDAALKE